MRVRNKVVFLFLLVLLGACSEAPVYEKVFSFDDKEWKQDQKLEYVVNIDNIDQIYDFTLTLRTTTDYKYSNLWVFMKTIAPDGSTGREPFQIIVTNPDGSWVGNKTGSVVETPLYFRQRQLPLKGKYTFILEQGITESEIDEVLDLSFRVEEVKQQE